MSKRIAIMLTVCALICLGQTCTPDSDRDGVSDPLDGCRNTPLCATVDADGCPSDADSDGVYDGCDECPNTPADTVVYSNGCPAEVPDGVASRCPQAPDPRAKEIEYSLVNLTGTGQGVVLIKGTAHNYGTEAYLSSPGQQALQLWENGVMVATQDFEDLAVDETVTIEYQRSWTKGGEFMPAQYELIVTYDPDIFDDGNSDNDDCRLYNNSLIRGTAGIDSLFD